MKQKTVDHRQNFVLTSKKLLRKYLSIKDTGETNLEPSYHPYCYTLKASLRYSPVRHRRNTCLCEQVSRTDATPSVRHSFGISLPLQYTPTGQYHSQS